jgi:hypothetical protein
MWRVGWLVSVALAFGAVSAWAQSPGIIPQVPAATPQPNAAVNHAAKSTATKPATVKPAAIKQTASRPAPKPKPEKTATVKPAATALDKFKQIKSGPDVFAGIPPDERLKIQQALLWAGDYPGATASAEPMLTAIKNFQKRHNAKITGVLTPTERSALIAAADTHEEEFGWSVVIDPATGIRIGLPTKLVPVARDGARGTRWSSPHGEVQVETFRIKDPTLKLSDLFEKEKKNPSTRRVETSVLHDDNFFISGLQGLKKFSVRAQMRNGEVRGFTMLFDQMMEGIVSPVMVAMSSAFSPFPEQSMPYASLTKRVEYGTGLVVSAQGHIVTDRNLVNGCEVIVAAGLGNAERIADGKDGNKDDGLALLRVYGPHKGSPLSLDRAAPPNADVTLVGIADPKEQNGGEKRTEVKAQLVDGTAIELRQPVPMAGFSGAAALDAQGHFLGMMEMRRFVLASAGPALPPVRLIAAKTIRNFLAAYHVKPAAAQSADARASVVRVICVRK